jgi:SAM-dependent methyltransferase
MGPSDWAILDDLRRIYPDHFNGFCIDAGSRNMNGSVRHFLGEKAKFEGIDQFDPKTSPQFITWQGRVHEYPGENIADLVTCFNTFEHDYYWRESMTRLVELLKPGGVFIFQLVCSGSEHGSCHPTEPYGDLLESGGRWYRNMDPEEVRVLLGGLPVEIKETFDLQENSEVEVRVDRWGTTVEPYQDKLTRRFYFFVGMKGD